MNKLLIICGATATGKTALAVECAKQLETEIISADSQLVYRELNIGTAKPTAREMQKIPHHLIDAVSPRENFSVSDYEEMAIPVIERLRALNKVPVICGGTGFYINSILYNLSYGNAQGNKAVRSKYENILSERGKEYLFSLLKSVDEKSAESLHVNDVKRVIRALEIYEVSGIKKSEQGDRLVPRYDYFAVAVDYPRDELYDRIDKRVDEMFSLGLVDEVKHLLDMGIDEKFQCMQAIGYNEVVQGLKNGLNQGTMRDIIKLNTRHYAKRQITFFKKLSGIVWLKPQEATARRVLEMYNGK